MIDANLNRSSEGLRVLEDVARFLLNDAELSQRLRTLRHDLARETESLSVGLLSQRDSEHDVGHPCLIPPGERELNIKTTSLRGLLDLAPSHLEG